MRSNPAHCDTTCVGEGLAAQVGGFLQVLRFPPAIKLTAMHDITEILLKVALNTITLVLVFGWILDQSYSWIINIKYYSNVSTALHSVWTFNLF